MIPKFRAWDKRFSEFVENFFLSEDGKIYKKTKDTNYGFAISRETSDKIILMQSTGLKDKNSKEIFEGDVVKTTRFFGRADEVGGFYEYDKELIGVVKKLEGAWVIDTGNDAVPLWSEIEENEVVGNIHEQPELLKKRGN